VTDTNTNLDAATGQSQILTGRRLRLVLGALMLTMLLAALDQTIVSTALPTITSDLGGLSELSWVVTAYLLASTASAPIWGKLSDLYGRKPMLQWAIVIFLIGSVLAGASASMWQLITTRALQGLGGGGLMVLVMAVIGDVIAPRDRGRYMGLFGAVFGLASIIGPLLGGFFTEQLSWRWIFYINIPLGLAALAVVGTTLHVTVTRREHSIDWLGAALMVGGVVSLLLVTVWGGVRYPWGSATIIGLGLLGVALLVGFVLQERRAPEPMVPLDLFAGSIFRVTSAIGFVVGFAMFGTIVFLSMYMQVVHGSSPTVAGLQLLPLMFGLILTSILSGRLISRTGHYRVFPIVGTAFATVGLLLFSRLGVDTPYWQIAIAALILGIGLGNVMQVLVLAVQNSVDMRQLGAATSTSTFFRSIGGSFGTAVFGAVLSSRLLHEMAKVLPPDVMSQVGSGNVTNSIGSISALPPQLQSLVHLAFNNAIDATFLLAVPVMALAFVLSLFLKEVPLRKAPTVEESLADDAAVPLPE
jgi:EmrB/QacA subfamily drug resistance transporter